MTREQKLEEALKEAITLLEKDAKAKAGSFGAPDFHIVAPRTVEVIDLARATLSAPKTEVMTVLEEMQAALAGVVRLIDLIHTENADKGHILPDGPTVVEARRLADIQLGSFTSLVPSPTDEAREGLNEFELGYIIAVSNIINLHDETVIAEDVMSQAGIKWSDVKASDLTDYDVDALKKIKGPKAFHDIKEKEQCV